MDELLTQFLIEGRELTADAHRALQRLARAGDDAAALDALFRAIHTLKGSVGLFEMKPAERMLHAAETSLARLRGEDALLTAGERDGLVAVIDQLDRWIDAMESAGRLPETAEATAREIVAEISREPGEPAGLPASPPDWLSTLLLRPQFAGRLPAAGGTAFRYSPDADCFFRGEDPLATAAAVPDLLALALLPAGPWPELDEFDPFRCRTIIEGVSSADAESVGAAFRLVPDQIAVGRVGPAAAAPADPGAASQSALRVEGHKLDRLARLAGELSVAVHGLDGLAGRAGLSDRALAADLKRAQAAIENATGSLHATIAAIRLVPLAPVLRRLPRLAREVAAALGKEVDFVIRGENTEADKQIADALFEPLLHLVRNAIDHGIEFPAEREAGGKSPRGRVSLDIETHGERLQISLADDGAGIDPEHLREAAIAKGLLEREAGENLSTAQALRLIFAPGFSTAKAVSSVSGRGVGMDAVLAAVERLQGSIEVESTPGTGTTLRLDLPLNAILTRLLTVSAGGELFGLRLDQISETLRVEEHEIHAVGQGRACVIRGRTVPVIELATLLGKPGETTGAARLVVTEATGEPVAVRVGEWGGRLDTMIRERSGLLAAIPAIGGTAVLGDGGVLLVLDLPELLS